MCSGSARTRPLTWSRARQLQRADEAFSSALPEVEATEKFLQHRQVGPAGDTCLPSCQGAHRRFDQVYRLASEKEVKDAVEAQADHTKLQLQRLVEEGGWWGRRP